MRLLRFEARLRELLEVRLIRALPGRRAEDLLVQHLTQAIENNVRVDDAGNRVAPNVYTLTVHRSSRPRWQDPALLEALLELIRSAGSADGLKFESPPTISFADDPSIRFDDLATPFSSR